MTKYTIIGAGAIGGTLGAYLQLGGSDVLLIDSNREHVESVQADGLEIRRPNSVLRVPVPITTPDRAPDRLGAVLLAVKAPATDNASRWIASRLRDDGWVASLQNGLLEPVIAAHVGPTRTVAGFVDLFADLVAPGIIQDGGHGAIALGEHCGPASDRVRALAADLRCWGRPVISDNVPGFLWAKLGFAAMLAATALVDEDMGDLIDRHRRGMHALVREILGVAVAEGVVLEDFDAFAPHAYLGRPKVADRATDSLVAWLATQAKKRSGYWRDLAVHRRGTEVSAQFGPVVQRASRLGLDVPLTRWLIATMADAEAGRLDDGEDALLELDELGRS
ncbi:ketopantoate reductase family protein [Leifsonia shinshuensis]